MLLTTTRIVYYIDRRMQYRPTGISFKKTKSWLQDMRKRRKN